MAIRFRSFRARLLAFVIGLLVLVQGAALLAVHLANLNGARRHIHEALELTASAFQRALEVRERILVEKARLLSSDFAFKEVVATGDRTTILSALDNHRARVEADVMLLLALSGEAIATTLPLERDDSAAALRALVVRAQEDPSGEASSIQLLDDVPYQLVVVPLFTPEPSAWIAIGFEISDSLARELQQQTGTQVSLVRSVPSGWSVFCTTLPDPARAALERSIPEPLPPHPEVRSVQLGDAEYVSWIGPVEGAGIPMIAVLQRSLEEALEPFLLLRARLFTIFAAGLCLSLAGGALIATGVTRPVADLVRGARRIEQGNYTDPVVVAQRDELGDLAASFNAMMHGLAERDRVRNLLGRVVSSDIAEELLSKAIELGGEERRVTILFTDIRGFTGLSEREDPQRLVQTLNTFLTAVSRAVEEHGGVVEEYMGDGAKALFGAPIAHSDDPLRAVRAALALRDALPEVNAEIARLGGEPLAIGIGIHTGVAVAGRVGSLARLKYTVVGDVVNVASRLEGLTRRYAVPIVASEATRSECPGIRFRELDCVQVAGRDAPITIFEPLGEES